MKKTQPAKNQPQKQSPTSPMPPVEKTDDAKPSARFTIPEGLLKNIFYGSLIAMLLTVLLAGYNVGFNSDEIELNNYGKANYKWYATGGKDTTLKQDYYKFLKYYGNAYEGIAVGINNITGLGKGKEEFNVRHAVSQVFAIVGLLFAGLTARRLSKSWLPAIFTVWLIFLTPSYMGHFLFNTRDIPFASGYIATLYFIFNFLDELPAPTWKTATGLMLAFAFTTNIRIGGVLLFFYLCLFAAGYLVLNMELLKATMKNVVNVLTKFAYVLFGGLTLVTLTWPYVLANPVSNLITAFGIASKFPLKVRINFEGNSIDSLTVPPHYIPKYMLVTIPIFVIFCILGGFVVYFLKNKQYNWKLGAMALFTILFPVAYAIATHAAIYTSWRHFLFIFPVMGVFGGIFLKELFAYSEKMPVKIAIATVCLLTMVKPVAFCMRNNPYEYCYFNELADDFKGAFLNYDNDYWEISVRNGLEWLMQNKHVGSGKDTVIIASNASAFVEYYVGRHYPTAKVKVISSGVTGRNSLYWQYAVYNSLFLKPAYLENFFPPEPCVHTEQIDGIPVSAVVVDTARLDYKALEALKQSKHALADSLYTAHIKNTKDVNPANYAYIAVAKASLGQNDEAIAAANKSLQHTISNVLDYNANCGLGIAYGNKQQFDLSIEYLRKAERIMPEEHYAKDILQQVYKVRAEAGRH